MSEARNQRFEIDIDEIERQLRRSVEAAPAAKPDPLAELARIVGQDDPFRGILGGSREPASVSNVHVLDRSYTPQAANTPVLSPADHRVLHGRQPTRAGQPSDELFDPVVDTYGSEDDAFSSEDLQPLRPRRSRGRLAAVMAALLVTAGAVAGGLYWRKSGASFGGTAGEPPMVVADKTPLKVAPTNPGGVEVPNQNRQIYDKGVTDTQSRVVDGREQPIDVREAAKSMPAPAISGRSPVASSPDMPPPASGSAAVDPAPRPAMPGNAVVNALGEPRRVRTTAFRPDGSVYSGPQTASLTDAAPSLLPGNSIPPAIPVSAVPVSGRPNGGGTAAAVAPSSAAPVPSEGAPVGTPVTVLPPARPRIEAKPARPREETPVRTAALRPTAPVPAEKPAAEKPAAGSGKFVVQIAVRPTEEEARQAYSQLQDKFASELDGRSARVTKGEVGGKTVHRVRVGPLSKDDANALCGRLKSSGGSCFVAAN